MMDNRRDYFETSQDGKTLFRPVITECKVREFDPAVKNFYSVI